MAQNVLLNGVVYQIPDVGDDNYGQNLTDYFVAIPQGVLQKSGGAFSLTAEVNFGATFGLLAQYYKTRTANVAAAGQFRLARADVISWRNAANSADLALGVNSSNQLTFNGNPLAPSGGLTASRAVVTDGTGLLAAATTTATEIGYVNGVTSAIQTQLNAKQASGDYATSGSGDVAWSAHAGGGAVTTSYSGTVPLNKGGTGTAAGSANAAFNALSPMTTGGDLIYGGASGAATRLANGSSGTFLMSNGTTLAPTWANPSAGNLTGDVTSVGLATTIATNVVTNAKAAQMASKTIKANVTGSTANATDATPAQVAAIFATPTIQKFLSSSGTYTTPNNAIWIRVRMVGGGGGGGGSGSGSPPAGGTGGNSTFGSSLLVANGGVGGTFQSGGAGGTASLGSGPIGVALQGGSGASGGRASVTTASPQGGSGAASPFGGSGGGNSDAGSDTGIAGVTNTGSGGGGASVTGGSGVQDSSGCGGGAGGFVDAIIIPTAAQTFAYAVGAAGSAGSAGTSGSAGGAGGSGIILVEEYYI